VIYLLDEPKRITRKLKRAVTDSGSEIRFSADKPGISNLLSISAAITGETIAALEAKYAGQGYGVLKGDVAEQVVDFLTPLQQRYHKIRQDRPELERILHEGASKARERAQKTLSEVYAALGFVRN
jgi:tryptophanyl-tRNA synthetase